MGSKKDPTLTNYIDADSLHVVVIGRHIHTAIFIEKGQPYLLRFENPLLIPEYIWKNINDPDVQATVLLQSGGIRVLKWGLKEFNSKFYKKIDRMARKIPLVGGI